VPTDTPDDWYEGFVRREIIGTPEDAIEKIEKMIDVSGGFGGILFKSRDWAGRAASDRSWELFARRVAPRFQGHVGPQAMAASVAGGLNAG
jgi:limonene 1,2-monooxygenase